MSQENNRSQIENDVLPVSPEDKTLSKYAIFSIWFSGSMVTTTMLTGMYFIPGLTFLQAIILILVGSFIGTIPLALVGVMGQKTGLVTMVAARSTFGTKGAILPSIVNVLIFIGWQWAQAGLGGFALNYLSKITIGFDSVTFYTILTEVIVIVIAFFAIKGISAYEKIAAILIAVVMLIVYIKGFGSTGIGNIFSIERVSAEGLTLMGVFDLVVASALSWVPMSADYNRNSKTVAGAVIGSSAGYTLGALLSMGAGALMVCMTMIAGKGAVYDPAEAFGDIGVGIPGAIAILLSVVAANVMCMYSSTVSLINIFPKLKYTPTLLIIGIICILGAVFSGILTFFLDFVTLIGVLFMPIFAIMIADYFVIRKQKLNIDAIVYPERDSTYKFTRGINVTAMIVFVISAVFAYVFSNVVPLVTGATIPTFVLAFVLYILLMKAKKN